MGRFSKNEIIIKLREELDKMIQFVVHSREALENELAGEWAQKKLSIDAGFLKKLKELTVCFNSLTESKIRLDKAEKQMEADMTPNEELETVKEYLKQMDPWELVQLMKMVRAEQDGREFVYEEHPMVVKAEARAAAGT